MKQLRILTGRHAGARLRLAHEECTVGSGDDADVQITDWKHRPVVLMFDEKRKVVRMTSKAMNGEQAEGRETSLEHLVPRRFDDIVLCVGPEDDAAWPSDVELMRRLLKPRRKARAPGQQKLRATALAGGLACSLMFGGFIAVLPDGGRKTQARTLTVPLQAQVAGALAKQGINSLAVRAVGQKVAVEGLVPGAADLSLARQTLRRFDGQIIHRYAAASSIAQSIADALADPALNVTYRGAGEFQIEGGVVDVGRLRTSASRIAGDIGPMVRRIHVVVTELPPKQRVHVNAMLVSGDLNYVQTRDGTKHLIVSTTGARDSSREPLIRQPQ